MKILKKILFIINVLNLSSIFLMMALFKTQSLSCFLIGEEFMFYIEEKIGLVHFYEEAKQFFDDGANMWKKKRSDLEDPEKKMVIGFHYFEDGATIYLADRRRNIYGPMIISPGVSEVPSSEWRLKWNNDIVFYGAIPGSCDAGGVLAELLCLLAIYALYPLGEAFCTRKMPRLILTGFALGMFYYYITSSDWVSTWDVAPLRTAIDTCNKEKLNQLFKDGTRIVTMPDNHRLFQNAPLFCGNQDFFETPFLCWKLEDFNYLYYMPNVFQERMFIPEITQITDLGNNFFCVQYPQCISAINVFFVVHHFIFFIVPIIIFTIRRQKQKLFPPLTSEKRVPSSAE